MNAPVQIGDILASKYRVDHVLGIGGMGVVVAARHVQLGTMVALKFMLPDTLRVPEASERFLREARVAAHLRGEHVARVIDFGTLESGAPYIVMDFLEGTDLEKLVRTRGPLSVAEGVGYVFDACKAMDEAHRAGVVHRDLKPTNLFLTQRHDGTPLVKVLDFGISKLSEHAEDPSNLTTRTGSVLGSPAFMSPEQIRNAKHVDARADIYSLGAVIYFLLTQAYPYEANSVGELFGLVLFHEPKPLRARRPDVPLALDALVGRCLQKDPNARFQNAKELMTALRAVLDTMHAEPPPPAIAQTGPLAEEPKVAPVAPSFGGQAWMSSQATGPKKVSGLPWVIVSMVCVIGVFVLIGGALFLRGRHRSTAVSAEAEAPHVAVETSAPAPSAESSVAPLENVSPAVPPTETSKEPARDAGASASEPARGSHGDRGKPKPHPAPSTSTLPHGGMYEK